MSTSILTVSPNQALWEKGDFTRIAETMRESGDELVEKLGVTPGLNVLDLGCGDGTTAIPAALRGAYVRGVDIAQNLVDAGNRRARDLALTRCTFHHGDAIDLHEMPDRIFDLTLSVFGAMFAPKPDAVAREMVRVTRPGGRIVMGNWIPNDPTLVAQVLRISSAYTPPPPEGFISPMLWGVEAEVTARFARAGIKPENIAFERDTFTFRHPGSTASFVELFRKYYGPTMNAFEAAGKTGRADLLQQDLETLCWMQNRSSKPGATVIPATYLRVTVNVPWERT